jgi:hypothetical protein
MSSEAGSLTSCDGDDDEFILASNPRDDDDRDLSENEFHESGIIVKSPEVDLDLGVSEYYGVVPATRASLTRSSFNGNFILRPRPPNRHQASSTLDYGHED